ncbi:MAG: HD domain-containing protein [Clostridium perfringens]|nr:HD domain-containing protein [Clostridium perfringens]
MKKYLKEFKAGKIEVSLMVNKILNRDGNMTAYLGDKSGDVRSVFKTEGIDINVGDILSTKGTLADTYKIDSIKKIKAIELRDYLPSVETSLDSILEELNKISEEEFKSEEAKALNDYFFKDEEFMSMFKDAIGGVYQHHNYLGGLAEHTLGVTYLTKVLCDRYHTRYREIAILGAKLHDIGKVYEMDYNGPFKYSLRGDLEGHIVIGITMLEEAFKENPNIYTEDFKQRIKAIIVQHHGKVEFGSPKSPNTQESYIVHYADYVDATLNKINIVGKDVEKGKWSDYERRIEGRLFM